MKITDKISVKELYKQYSGDVYRYAYSILKIHDGAQDALQEVFARFMESQNEYKGKCSNKTWLFTITRNYCYDKLKEKNHKNVTLDENLNLFNYPDHDNIISLQDAMKQLTEEQNELIYLRDYEGYSMNEIALLTEQSVDNVKIKLFRAKKKLKELFDEKG